MRRADFSYLDYFFMKEALKQAVKAFKSEEVPVGAVVVDSEGRIIARQRNRILERNDPTAHAEILAIKEACQKVGNYRLNGCKVYVTLEPCPMCAYAMVLARIEELIVATLDPKTGAACSLYQIINDSRLNHRIKLKIGVFKDIASELLKTFFILRR